MFRSYRAQSYVSNTLYAVCMIQQVDLMGDQAQCQGAQR